MANSSVYPSRCGFGTDADSVARTSSRSLPSSGVSMMPGAIVQTRMFFDARSRAATIVMPTIPALAAE
jgi:hypothetical protein